MKFTLNLADRGYGQVNHAAVRHHDDKISIVDASKSA